MASKSYESMGYSQIDSLQQKTQDIKLQMIDNVQKVEKRGEYAELNKKTENLEHKADEFRRLGEKVVDTYKCRNARLWVILIFAVGIPIFLAVLLIVMVILLLTLKST